MNNVAKWLEAWGGGGRHPILHIVCAAKKVSIPVFRSHPPCGVFLRCSCEPAGRPSSGLVLLGCVQTALTGWHWWTVLCWQPTAKTHTHYTLLRLWYIVEDQIFKKPLGNIYITLVRSNIYTCVVMINEKCIFMYISIYWMYGKYSNVKYVLSFGIFVHLFVCIDAQCSTGSNLFQFLTLFKRGKHRTITLSCMNRCVYSQR